MTNMRERIARAMCGPSWDATNFNETPDGSSPEENREYYLHMADLALDTLLEPTEGMSGAFSDRFSDWLDEIIEDPMHPYKMAIQAARDGL